MRLKIRQRHQISGVDSKARIPMPSSSADQFAIICATKDRHDSVKTLLASLSSQSEKLGQIILADVAQSQDLAAEFRETLDIDCLYSPKQVKFCNATSRLSI